MPSYQTGQTPPSGYPFQFTSPYGDVGIIPLYSCIPILPIVAGCLPCVLCGNSTQRTTVLEKSTGLVGNSNSQKQDVEITLTPLST
jgi:hypothetical protein